MGTGTFYGDAAVKQDYRHIILGDMGGAVVNQHSHWMTVGVNYWRRTA